MPPALRGAKVWFGDAATYPILGITFTAACFSTFCIIRNATGNPGVKFNKEERAGNMFNHKAEDGSAWRKHRFWFANLKPNAINRSEQFDDLWAKRENSNIKRD